MAFALLIIGIVMVVSAVRGSQDLLVQTVKGEFQGQGNFIYWVAAILIIGAIGYSESLRPLSTGLLVLILLSLFLTRSKSGLFNQLTSALGSTAGGSPTNTTGLENVVTNLSNTFTGAT